MAPRRKLEITTAMEWRGRPYPHVMVADSISEEVLAVFFIKPEMGMTQEVCEWCAKTALGRAKRSKPV